MKVIHLIDMLNDMSDIIVYAEDEDDVILFKGSCMDIPYWLLNKRIERQKIQNDWGGIGIEKHINEYGVEILYFVIFVKE